MGGFKDCTITLDNPWSTYYCGQTVNGRADLILEDTKKIRGIFVTIKGECETNWTNNASRRDQDGKTQNYTENCKGNEEYFSISYYLIGSKSGGEIDLPAGTNSYNFTCALPPTLPSSFEGEFGFVRYTIKITMDRPWKFDHETKMAFTVISPLDLNLNPVLKEPFRIQMEDTFCCCWCKSGPLSVDVSMPVSGYCPGQTIPVHIDCENHSSVEVHAIVLKLRKRLVFRTIQPYKDTKESLITITEFKVGPVAKSESNSFDQVIEVPPLPPSNLTNCGLIDLDYDFNVLVEVSGMHCNLEETKSITIGTVPLVGYQPPPPQGLQPSNTNGQPAPPSNYPTQPVTSPGYPVQPANTVGYPGQTDPNQPAGGMYPPPNGPPNQPYPSNVPQNVPVPTQPGANWNSNPVVPPHQSLYPQLAAPSYQQSPYTTNIIKDSTDNEYTRISGKQNFAPNYPTYAYNPAAATPPQ